MKPEHVPSDHAPDPVDVTAYASLLREHLPSVDAIATAARKRRRRRVAASVAALALVGTTVLRAVDPVYSTQRFVAAQSVVHATLPDGSTLTLNRGAEVEVALHVFSRRFTLARGEALFAAQHSLVRSFVVTTPDAIIEDIGTVFDVNREAVATTVTVSDGRVRAINRTSGQRTEVGVNEAATLHRDGGVNVAYVNAEDASAWRVGMIVFNGARLEDVARDIARYDGPTLHFDDAQAAQLQISGQFQIARLQSLPAMLPTIAPVRIRHGADGVVYVASRATP